MTDIIELDDATVSQIAAGEVVERPASVVKELLENSLDADAARIDITVKEAGTELIRVADDGHGMTQEEARLAVQEHTTSKIRDIDDLETGLGTLGFRGEALHAIGAVATLTVTTKPADSDRATEVVVDHGEVTTVGPAGRATGTTIDVTDLFANTPARRKFLKSTATEFDHVNRIATRYALANPDVAISLTHDDHEVFATTGQGDLQAALLAVYGREVAESMIELPDHDMVSGYVSHPETTRSTRDYLSTYINGRYVQANVLRRAIVDAYGNQLGSDRYPFAVLFLDLDPAGVDVNVHPRKLEVRFDDEEAVTDAVQETVREALLDHGLIRTTAARGRGAPEETTITPETGQPADAETTQTEPEADADADADADAASTPTGAAETDPPPGTEPSPSTETTADTTADAGPPPDTEAATTDAPSSPPETQQQAPETGTAAEADERGGSDATPKSPTAETATDTDRHESGRVRSAGTQLTLESDTVDQDAAFDRLPHMRILGQAQDSYLVADTDDGIILVDQHAADERVNYERLRERFAGDVTTQALAEPVDIELTAREAELFDEHRDALAQLGFRASRVDDRTVRVTTVPALIADAAGPDLVRDLLGEFVAGDPEGTVEAVADELLADLACYPALTANTSLREGSVRDLLEALDDCENPYACPHGRPVVIEISESELEERFERDYPGHPTR